MFIVFTLSVSAEIKLNIELNKTFGDSGVDSGNSVQQTSDGGYIIAGYTNSFGAGQNDFWLIKTDSNGNQQWNKTFGTPNDDRAYSVVQTSDGGYAVAGSVNFSTPLMYYREGWLIKTDSNGNQQWNKTFGDGTTFDEFFSLQQTIDGGYILAGIESFQTLIIKTDSNGNEQWRKIFNIKTGSKASSIRQTSDGSYIIAGGPLEVSLLKIDSNGNQQWNNTFYGGAGRDSAHDVRQTSDGSYIIVGGITYPSYDVDFWLIKTDSNGNQQWNKTFGGSAFETAYSIVNTSDNSYIVAGYTNSFGNGLSDVWLLKIDSNGNQLWNKTIGGTGNDVAISMQATSDGGLIIAGNTSSFGAGSTDILLVKLAPLNVSVTIPKINITSILSNVTTNTTIYIVANFSDPDGFSSVCELCINPINLGIPCTNWVQGNVTTNYTSNTTGSCTFVWNTSNYARDDFYSFTFRINDTTNMSGNASTRITLDRNPPYFSVYWMVNSLSARTGSHVGINYDLNESDMDQFSKFKVTFQFKPVDLSQSITCSLLIDSKLNATNTKVREGDYNEFYFSLSRNIQVKEDHNWSIRCSDEFGFISTEDTRPFTLFLRGVLNSTDFFTVNISRIDNLTFENASAGKVRFWDLINLSEVYGIFQYIKIFNNFIDINTTAVPILNKSATLYLYNLTFKSTPIILKNDVACPNSNCKIINYSKGILIFNATQFSFYTTIPVSPNITSTPITNAKELETYTYKVITTNPENYTLYFSDNTDLFDINSTTGTISFVPEFGGNYPINITVSDGFVNISQIYNLIIEPSGGGGSSGGGSSSGGGGGSSGGGGGGGTAGFVCNKDWQCSDWSDCINGQQTRQCSFAKVPQHVQETECPEESKPPATSRTCEVKKEIPINNLTVPINSIEKSKPANESNLSNQIVKTGKENEGFFNKITGAFNLIKSNPKALQEIKLTSWITVVIVATFGGLFYYRFFRSKR